LTRQRHAVGGPGQRRSALREVLTDLYARALLVLEVFSTQFVRLTPLWLVGVWLGATLAWFLAPRIARWRRGHTAIPLAECPLGGLLLGSVLGILSPFSLLSLIALLRELERERRLWPWVVGFALASPLLDPTMFVFTILALGPRLAVPRVIVSLLAAWLGGAIVLRRLGLPIADLPVAATPHPPPASGVLGYSRHLGRHLLFTGRHYLLALLLTAWIQVLLPLRTWISAGVPGGALEILWAAGLGVPLYVCGGGAVALADGLARSGMSQGAVLAYLTVGAATTPRALTALVALVGRRGTTVFVSCVVGVGFLGGYLLNVLT
jgi:uncharacterized membrane protein YraQ (UPF0718 family)